MLFLPKLLEIAKKSSQGFFGNLLYYFQKFSEWNKYLCCHNNFDFLLENSKPSQAK